MTRISESDLPWTETDRGETVFRRKQLSDAAGGEEIGCSLYEIPAGRRSWPYHYHTGNEEAIYVLGGEGVLRHDGEREPLAAGDYVALPAGEDGGHRVINDSEGPLRYLAISTMADPDVLVYPDSGKVGLYTGSAPGDHENRELTKYFPMDADVDYWQDEA